MEIGEQEGVAVSLHALDVERLVEFQESHRAITFCQYLTELCAALPVSGDEITVHCDGPDEKEAIEAVCNLIETGLKE